MAGEVNIGAFALAAAEIAKLLSKVLDYVTRKPASEPSDPTAAHRGTLAGVSAERSSKATEKAAHAARD